MALDEEGVAASKTRQDGTEAAWTVTVPRGEAGKAHRVLAARQLPRARPQGLGEVFAQGGMVPTPVEERARWLHALSGELARSVEALDGVVEAHVHLGLPADDPLRPGLRPAPRAAVLVKCRPAACAPLRELEPGLRSLVAGAVGGAGAGGGGGGDRRGGAGLRRGRPPGRGGWPRGWPGWRRWRRAPPGRWPGASGGAPARRRDPRATAPGGAGGHAGAGAGGPAALAARRPRGRRGGPPGGGAGRRRRAGPGWRRWPRRSPRPDRPPAPGPARRPRATPCCGGSSWSDGSARSRNGPRSGAAGRPGRAAAREIPGGWPARTVNALPAIVPLPFDLPRVSRGFAALDRGARAIGAEAAAAAARAMAEVLGVEVTLTGSARPVVAAPARPLVQLAVELGALPGSALLEVEPALVARLVGLVSGGGEPVVGATALTPLEESALELLVLAAIDGAAALDRPSPSGWRRAWCATRPPPRSPLAIDLELGAGGVQRSGPAAAAAGGGRGAGRRARSRSEPLLAFPLFASLRGGTAPLLPEELRALAPGDVVLADPPPEGRHRLVFPGGFTAVGHGVRRHLPPGGDHRWRLPWRRCRSWSTWSWRGCR